jgi:hypothetical protein
MLWGNLPEEIDWLYAGAYAKIDHIQWTKLNTVL